MVVKLKEAIKLPFSDWNKLLIGFLVYFVSGLLIASMMVLGPIGVITMILGVLGMGVASGYILTSGSNVLKKKFVMPKWTNFGSLFIKGILGGIVELIYVLPGIILLFIGMGNIIFNKNIDPASMGIWAILGFALLLLGAYVANAAIIGYSRRFKFSEGFSSNVWKNAFSWRFFSTFIVIMIYALIVAFVANIIPVLNVVLSPAANFILGISTIAALAANYKK